MNILPVILLGQMTYGIVNGRRQSGIAYIRQPNDRGPSAWQSGVNCLQAIGSLYLTTRVDQARNYHSMTMVIAHSVNMSSPAAQIQDEFLSMKNKALNPGSKPNFLDSFLALVVSDSQPLSKQKFSTEFIIRTDAYIIIIDDVDRVESLVEDYMSKMQYWNPGARFLILYNQVDDRDQGLEVADEIFRLLLYRYYVNTVSLLYAVNTTAYRYYVLDNFNPEACRAVRIASVGSCDTGTIPNEFYVRFRINQFIRKADLRNCTFFMCAAIAAPFVENDCDQGMEMHLIQVIQEQLGFKLNTTCGEHARGVRVPENDTWTDLLGMLDDRICDFILGGFFSDDEVREDFWSTDTYLFNSHTWFAAAASPNRPWKALFVIFQTNIWIGIIVILLVTWFFWFTFGCILPEKKSHKSLTLTAINSWGVTLCASVNERPECQASRIFFIGLCIYSMNVTGLYTSKLIAVFADPGYEHQISTIDEVIRHGIPFGGPAENRDWFQNDDDMKIYTRYNDSDNFVPRARNVRAVVRGERVILANRKYMLRSQYVDNLYGFPENVFSSPVEIIAKRGFPFLDRFNALIRRMKDSGLFQKIDKDFQHHYTVLVKIRQHTADQEEVIVLTIHHLEGAFWFLLIGILLSIVAFVGEQINYRYFYPWLCTKCKWKMTTTDKQRSRKTKVRKMKARQTSEVRQEHSIRFTPVKRRRIRLN